MISARTMIAAGLAVATVLSGFAGIVTAESRHGAARHAAFSHATAARIPRPADA